MYRQTNTHVRMLLYWNSYTINANDDNAGFKILNANTMGADIRLYGFLL